MMTMIIIFQLFVRESYMPEVEKLEVNVQVWKSKQSMVELEEQLKRCVNP